MSESRFHLISGGRRDPRRPGDSNGGDGGDLRERVAVIETEIKHLATKEDFQKLKVWVLSGVIGGMAIAAGLAVAILKLLTN